MAWTLVTPSSRGIGFALTRHLLRTTPSTVPIVATTRKDPSSTRSEILSDLELDSASASRLDVQHVDLLSELSISNLAAYCKDRYQPASKKPADGEAPAHLRLALFVPGMLQPERSPGQISYETALHTLQLNLLAPMMLLKHFTPFLPRKSTSLESVPNLPDRSIAALMSARVGSISDNKLSGWYSYRASKAGVNQLVKTTDHYLRAQSAANAICVALHPGTVKTGLSREFWQSTKPEKLFEPDFAAESLVRVLLDLGKADRVTEARGRCWDWAGKEIPP